MFCGAGVPICQAGGVCSSNLPSVLSALLVVGSSVFASMRLWFSNKINKKTIKNEPHK
jgi:uncharacterized membrane protein YfcA